MSTAHLRRIQCFRLRNTVCFRGKYCRVVRYRTLFEMVFDGVVFLLIQIGSAVFVGIFCLRVRIKIFETIQLQEYGPVRYRLATTAARYLYVWLLPVCPWYPLLFPNFASSFIGIFPFNWRVGFTRPCFCCTTCQASCGRCAPAGGPRVCPFLVHRHGPARWRLRGIVVHLHVIHGVARQVFDTRL